MLCCRGVMRDWFCLLWVFCVRLLCLAVFAGLPLQWC